jgi:hypothetical protein
MNFIIEVGDELGAVLTAHAQAKGLSPDRLVNQVLEQAFSGEMQPGSKLKPLKTGRGMLAKYGVAPSAEEIDENRREMFSNFAKDLL